MVAAVMVVVMVRSSSRLLRRAAGMLSTSLDAVGRRPHATTVARCSTSSPVSSGMGDRVLTMDTLNPHVRAMEYAVRGPIVIRAAQIDRGLQQVVRRGFHRRIWGGGGQGGHALPPNLASTSSSTGRLAPMEYKKTF